jgi:hypothetical protein
MLLLLLVPDELNKLKIVLENTYKGLEKLVDSKVFNFFTMLRFLFKELKSHSYFQSSNS